MNSIFVAVLVCFFTGRGLAGRIYIGGFCADDAECTETISDSECYMKYSNCARGECRCKKGYYGLARTDVCLQNKNAYDDCNSTTHCVYGTECDSSTSSCKCTSGNTYNPILKLCVTAGLQAVGETCSSVSDCYGSSTMVECSSSKCACKSGYLKEGFTCRQPYVTKDCTAEVGCTNQTNTPTFVEQETCVREKCKCPDTADAISFTDDGVTKRFCFTKYKPKKAAGKPCKQGNECSSHRCGTCPGKTDSICLKYSGAEKVGSISLLFYVAAVVMAFVL